MTGTVESAKNKAKEVAIEDFNKARSLAQDAVKSGAYLYPIKGIIYFLTHRPLWTPLLSKLLPTLTLSLIITTTMFLLTYIPQLTILLFTTGPLAAFSTILLVLSESSTLTNILSRTFLLQDALVDTFDGVLVSRNETGILAEGRVLKSGNFNDPIRKLGRLVRSPFERYSPKAVVRYFLYLPLNFIPVVGTVVFVLVQGRSRGETIHLRYFQLKKWSNAEREAWLKENTAAYTAFGTVATLLELIPFASIFFTFTNQVGAALFASDIEKNNTHMTELKGGAVEEIKKTE